MGILLEPVLWAKIDGTKLLASMLPIYSHNDVVVMSTIMNLGVTTVFCIHTQP